MPSPLALGLFTVCTLLCPISASAKLAKKSAPVSVLFGHTSLTDIDAESGQPYEFDTKLPFNPSLSVSLHRPNGPSLTKAMSDAGITRLRMVCEATSSGTSVVTYAYGYTTAQNRLHWERKYPAKGSLKTYVLGSRSAKCTLGPIAGVQLLSILETYGLYVYTPTMPHPGQVSMLLNRAEGSLRKPLKRSFPDTATSIRSDVGAPVPVPVIYHTTLPPNNRQANPGFIVRVSSSGQVRDLLSGLPLDIKLTSQYGSQLGEHGRLKYTSPRFVLNCQKDHVGKTWVVYDRVTLGGSVGRVDRWAHACTPGPIAVGMLMTRHSGRYSDYSYGIFKSATASTAFVAHFIGQKILSSE